MTLDEARAAIESLFAAGWSATAVAYPNVDFTPPAHGGPWVRLAVEPTGATQASFGGDLRRFRCTGVALVEVRVAAGSGTAGALRLADDVAGLFAGAGVPGLTFEAASTYPGPEDPAYFCLRVAAPFWHDAFR